MTRGGERRAMDPADWGTAPAFLFEDDLGARAETVKRWVPKGASPGEIRQQRMVLRPFPLGPTRMDPNEDHEVLWVEGAPFGILRPSGALGRGEIWVGYGLGPALEEDLQRSLGENLLAWTLGQTLLTLGEAGLSRLAEPGRSDEEWKERARELWERASAEPAANPIGEGAFRAGSGQIAGWRARREALRLEGCAGGPSGSRPRRGV